MGSHLDDRTKAEKLIEHFFYQEVDDVSRGTPDYSRRLVAIMEDLGWMPPSRVETTRGFMAAAQGALRDHDVESAIFYVDEIQETLDGRR